jgi:hypothetical protein
MMPMKQQQWRGEAVDKHLPDPLDLEELATRLQAAPKMLRPGEIVAVDIASMQVPFIPSAS